MIEKQTIDDRKAAVAYLTKDLEPADKDAAELIKVVFDDGETLWLTPPALKEEEMIHPPREPDDPKPEVEEPEDDESEIDEPEDEG